MSNLKHYPRNKTNCTLTKFILYLSVLFLLLIFFHLQASPLVSYSSNKFTSWEIFKYQNKITTIVDAKVNDALTTKLRDSVTFFPLKDLRFTKSAMDGHTWYMSSLNDTNEDNEAQHLYFPSKASKGRILCFKGNDKSDGSKNSYGFAFLEALPEPVIFLKGLTFVSDTYYDHKNLWHGLCAMIPFVSWSSKNECLKPTRWVLSHWGEFRTEMGSWLNHLMKPIYGNVNIEKIENGNVPYCLEKALVMRHDMGKMGAEKLLQVFGMLRCKAREACDLNPIGKGREVNGKEIPIISLTLLMRRGSRSFKDPKMVRDIFAKECEKFEGCKLSEFQSEDLNFCDQVRVMTNTDIIVSPHGAQLTNMFFMDQGSSVLEFFPKGWLEHGTFGQYVFHWLARLSGIKHEGAWRDPVGDECPDPKDKKKCFMFHKNRQIGHNETYFAEWAKKVLSQARIRKKEQNAINPVLSTSGCAC